MFRVRIFEAENGLAGHELGQEEDPGLVGLDLQLVAGLVQRAPGGL